MTWRFLAGVLQGIRHVVQKKSVYRLRLLDSNDTRLLNVWGFPMLNDGLVNVGEFLYVLTRRLKARYKHMSFLRYSRMKDREKRNERRTIHRY
jgi:hypothetical protein